MMNSHSSYQLGARRSLLKDPGSPTAPELPVGGTVAAEIRFSSRCGPHEGATYRIKSARLKHPQLCGSQDGLPLSKLQAEELLSTKDGSSRVWINGTQNKRDRVTRNVSKLVSLVTERVCSGLELSDSVVEIVRSLIWPFIARRTTKPMLFRDDKELGRFVNSFRYTAGEIDRYSCMSDENYEQTFVKYWLDSALCQVFEDAGGEDLKPQLPKRDPWNTTELFRGYLRKYLARAVLHRDIGFIYSLQKGSKRAWPKLDDVKEKKALSKHAERMSSPREPVPFDVLEQIRATSLEVFASINVKNAPFTKFMPTGSACQQVKVKHGGCLALTNRMEDPFGGPAAILGKLRALDYNVQRWRKDEYRRILDGADGQMVFDTDDEFPVGNKMTVVAIPEPSKFRIITIGDGYIFSALQPLQGSMLSCWKRRDESSMLRDDLTSRVNEMSIQMSDMPYVCSVDYEAATDLQNRETTVAALRCLTALPSWDLAMASFFGGLAKYPGKRDPWTHELLDGEEDRYVHLDEGQPMGHPLSFPLLCVVNLACYRSSILRWLKDRLSPTNVEIARRLWRNVLVNGDDMLFFCTRELYDIFVITASSAGFQMSQGKQYLSKDCCMINSQIFRRTNGVFRRYGYLNMKIILGVSLKTGESRATPDQIGKDLSKMARLASWTSSAIPFAFSRFGKARFGIPSFQPNWYLPVHLGGYGLDPDMKPSYMKYTKGQLQMAARFIHDSRMVLFRTKGLSIPCARLASALANWIWVGPFDPLMDGLSPEIGDEWLGRLAYAWRAHVGSKPKDVEDDRIMFSRFRPDHRLKPMSLERLEFYSKAHLVAYGLPVCPPLQSFHLKHSVLQRIFREPLLQDDDFYTTLFGIDEVRDPKSFESPWSFSIKTGQPQKDWPGLIIPVVEA